MCRCRQPQRQASIIKTTLPSPSTSSSPAPTTPSPTPPPLQPVTFPYMSSFRDSLSKTQQQQHEQKTHNPHYFYYQDSYSYSSSSSPAHEAATITAKALVHASCSLPSLHHATNTASNIQSMQSNSPASTLSRSLTIMPSALPPIHANTQTVLEHCSCGLTFTVDHSVQLPSSVEENILTEVPVIDNNEESFAALDSASYYETISETPIVEHVHQHHSHHHGHIHYHMNSHDQTHNIRKQPSLQYQTEKIEQCVGKDVQLEQEQTNTAAAHHHQHHHHSCHHNHNCQSLADQSFVQ